MVKNHGQSWFGPSLLYMGPTIQENHNKQMLLTFQECLPLKNHHVCAQSTGTFHQTVASEPNEESSDECEQCSEDDGESSELFTQAFAVKGSTYEESYQSNLKTVQSAIRSQQEIVVNLVPERDNSKDANAIRVVVSV